EHLALVLAEARRRAAYPRTLAVEEREPAGEREGRSVDRNVPPERARPELLVGVDVCRVGDRVPEHVARDHAIEELALRERRDERTNLGLEPDDIRLRPRSIGR